MSVAYQSWEVAGGPTVGYNVGTKGNHCGAEGPSYKRHLQQDSVVRGLSAMSLYVHSEPDSEPSVVDSRDDSGVMSKCKQDAPQKTSMIVGSTLDLCRNRLDHIQRPGALQHHIYKGVKCHLSSLTVGCSLEGNRILGYQGMPDAISSYYQHLPALGVVSEDRPWENCSIENDIVEPDSVLSFSSISSDVREDSRCTSADASNGTSGDMEVQSSYRGPLDCLGSLEPSLPTMKKGLSRFFSGKSRSFTCLADVVSVKDLAKPENPYARKRKNFSNCSGSLERPKLHPVRNGSAGISKKPLYNNKSTLALAVAMSTQEGILEGGELECQIPFGASRSWQSSSAPSRSYSLSDLQRAGH